MEIHTPTAQTFGKRLFHQLFGGEQLFPIQTSVEHKHVSPHTSTIVHSVVVRCVVMSRPRSHLVLAVLTEAETAVQFRFYTFTSHLIAESSPVKVIKPSTPECVEERDEDTSETVQDIVIVPPVMEAQESNEPRCEIFRINRK